MKKSIQLFLVLLSIVSQPLLANETFLKLVKLAVGTELSSPQWKAVEEALDRDPFMNLDWKPDGDYRPMTYMAVNNRPLLVRHNAALVEYEKLWLFVRNVAVNPGPHNLWGSVRVALQRNRRAEIIDWKSRESVSIRTMLLLYNEALYEQLFGYPGPYPTLWLRLLDAIVHKVPDGWKTVHESIKSTPHEVNWRVPGGQSILEIIEAFAPDYYAQRLALHPEIANSYELKRILGSGKFGIVKEACHRTTGQVVAVKELKKAQYEKYRLKYPPREIALLNAVGRHPHLVYMFESVTTPNSICLLLELASGVEMFAYCNERGALSEREARGYLRQILSAVDFLHRHGVAHRDLKLENVVLARNGHVRVVDLGLGNFMENAAPLKTFCGSEDYASAEIVGGRPYLGTAADVWSMGAMLFIMLTGYLPFNSKQNIADIKYTFPLGLALCVGVKLLFGSIFVPEAARISVEDMINNNWINDNGNLQPIERLPVKEKDPANK